MKFKFEFFEAYYIHITELWPFLSMSYGRGSSPKPVEMGKEYEVEDGDIIYFKFNVTA